MRLFDKLKGQANSWLQDEKNLDARKEFVFPDFIKVTDEIERIWTSDPGYEKSYSDVMYAKVKANTSANAATQKALNEALATLNGIKRILISENSARIYSLATIIQGLQRRHMDLWPFIGETVNLDEVLGDRGSKLQNRDINALLYIDELIERGENLKAELNNVNANKMRREANQIFRK